MENEQVFDAAAAQELSGFSAQAARDMSHVDVAVGTLAALAEIRRTATKGWTNVRLDGPGWREAGENGDALRDSLRAKGFTVAFDESERKTSVRW